MWYIALQRVALRCIYQCVAVCCSYRRQVLCLCAAVCFSVLQRVALCCVHPRAPWPMRIQQKSHLTPFFGLNFIFSRLRSFSRMYWDVHRCCRRSTYCFLLTAPCDWLPTQSTYIGKKKLYMQLLQSRNVSPEWIYYFTPRCIYPLGTLVCLLCIWFNLHIIRTKRIPNAFILLGLSCFFCASDSIYM